jgi:hypothetical protein
MPDREPTSSAADVQSSVRMDDLTLADDEALAPADRALPPPSARSSTGFAGGTLPGSALPLPAAPSGAEPGRIQTWFDAVSEVSLPTGDGSLAAERDAAHAFQRLAKADNTRRAYRAAVAAWCDWCAKRNLPPLPGSSQDVAAFLASERLRGLKANTLDLRRAGTRYLHRVGAVPCRPLTPASRRPLRAFDEAAGKGEPPRNKAAATAGIIEQFLAPIPEDLRGLRDRALILVGFAGALRRSELAAIQMRHLERTEKGVRLVLPRRRVRRARP